MLESAWKRFLSSRLQKRFRAPSSGGGVPALCSENQRGLPVRRRREGRRDSRRPPRHSSGGIHAELSGCTTAGVALGSVSRFSDHPRVKVISSPAFESSDLDCRVIPCPSGTASSSFSEKKFGAA